MGAVYAIIGKKNTDGTKVLPPGKILQEGLANYGRGGASEPSSGEKDFCVQGSRFILGSVQNHAHIGVPYTPCVVETEKYAAVCDAMIYNRDSFQGFGELSDGELLVRVYETEGLPGLRSLSADFAAILINKAEGEIILLRDHMGVRPLYLLQAKEYIAVSTDYRPFFELPDNEITINESNLYEHLTMGIVSSLTQTLFANITKAQAGSVTKVDRTSGTVMYKRYWTPGMRHVPRSRFSGKKKRARTDRKYESVYARLLRQAVVSRAEAVGSVAIGAEFSGGLDSGIVVSILDEYAKENSLELPPLASWSPSTKEYPVREKRDEVIRDEREIIERFCKEKGNQCIFRARSDSENVQKYLEEVRRREICEYDADIIAYTMRALGGKGIRTVFSGWGGDEAVTMRFGPAQLLKAKEYSAFLHEAMYVSKGRPKKFLGYIRRAFRGIREMRTPWDGVAINGWDFSVTTKDFEERIRRSRGKKFLLFGWDLVGNLLSGGMESRTLIAASAGADRGMVYMFPMLDPLLIDFALTVPRRLFMKDGIRRLLPQKALSDILPDYLTRFSGDSNVEKLDTGRMDFFYEVTEEAQRQTDETILSDLSRELFGPYVDFENLKEHLIFSEDQSERNFLRRMMKTLYKIQLLLGVTSQSN